MPKKQEFKVEFHKDINDCWCGGAYIYNRKTGKVMAIHVEAGPGTKATEARPYIRDSLIKRCQEYIDADPNWVRVTKEQADEVDLLGRRLDI